MANSSKKRRISQQYYIFFFSFLVSLLGLLFYILCSKKIPFPHRWLPDAPDAKNNIAKNTTKLFFVGIGAHLQANSILWIAFSLINTEKMDHVKVQKWRFWIGRVLIFFFSLFMGLSRYWKNVGNSWSSILFLSLIITVINCCLLELLIQLMNQYGICNAFSLILFTEFTPFDWLKKNWNTWWMLLLFIITVCFIWIINLKWEVPIETNTLYSHDSKVLKKNKSKLGFRLSFSFMPLIYLSSFISSIHSFVIMKEIGTNWFSISELFSSYEQAGKDKLNMRLNNEKGFWKSFFLLGDSSTEESKQIFKWSKIKTWFGEKKWAIISAFLFLIFLRWLVVWLQMRKGQWKTREISKDLRNRGIYINHLPPGRTTRNLLKKIINKLVLFWNVIILVFGVIFDTIFTTNPILIFSSWLGGTNIGVDLIKQIKTKYKYIKTSK